MICIEEIAKQMAREEVTPNDEREEYIYFLVGDIAVRLEYYSTGWTGWEAKIVPWVGY